ncbi:MAG: S41 family peptidase [Pseudomonas sp.]|uniref:S41 family peptidase n=1 Tax=Pseudomonas sp. TaxID=306 RepID=UPI003399AB31
MLDRYRPLVLLGLLVSSLAQGEPALWLREPRLSPDGTQLVFRAHGRLYRVDASGGAAYPVTGSHYYAHHPVWSADGRQLAFAANLYGNDDVFLLPAVGGELRRLTRHSADDWPLAFGDGDRSLRLASRRLGRAQSDFYLAEGSQNGALYRLNLQDGALLAEQALPAPLAQWNAAQDCLLYQMPGMDQPWRKHQRSFAVSRVWSFDAKSGEHRQLSEDRIAASDPQWQPGQRAYYYLSERSGDFNVWHRDLQSGQERQVTRHQGHPVRDLSVAGNGDLAYAFDGQLYRLKAGESEPKALPIELLGARDSGEQNAPLEQVDDFVVSADGREVILVSQGDLYALDTRRKRVRQLTETPAEEQAPLYSRDGHGLIYTSEQDGQAALYRLQASTPDTSLVPAQALESTLLLRLPGQAISQPRLSPDGRQLAFVLDRQAVHVLDLASGTQRQLVGAEQNTWRDGLELSWSPDSRRLALTINPDTQQQDVALVELDGSAPLRNVSLNGYRDADPHWSSDGAMLYWQTGQYASFGADSESTGSSLLGYFVSRQAKGHFLDGEKAPSTGYRFEVEGLEHRQSLLVTPPGEVLASHLQGDQLTYVLLQDGPVGRKAQVYRHDLRNLKTELLPAELPELPEEPQVRLSGDGKRLYLLLDGEVQAFDLEDETQQTFAFELRQRASWQSRMAASFDQLVRETRSEFYREDMNGVDWQAYADHYRDFLPQVSTPQDYAILLGELAGELNVSHTWAYTQADSPYAEDHTASLGLYFAREGAALTIAGLLPGGPFDLAQATPGEVLLAVNGQPVANEEELAGLLNHQAGQRLSLTLVDAAGDQRIETVSAISLAKENTLALRRWVERRREQVRQASQGRVGYVYLPEMSAEVFQAVVAEALGRQRNAELLIVDVRFNKGGYLANTLVGLLTGKGQDKGMGSNAPRVGQGAPDSASRQWTKASLLLANAGSYSEGSFFSQVYHDQKVGPLLGEPVPGTGTVVYEHLSRLLPGLSYGIPQMQLRMADGRSYENQELLPDREVRLTPADLLEGRDPQLDAAIDTALASLKPRQ